MRVRPAAAVEASRRAERSADVLTARPTLVLAAAGRDPVAERAVADPELDKVARIFPIDRIPVAEIGDESPTMRAHRTAADQLGRELDLTAAIVSSSTGSACLPRRGGRITPTTSPVPWAVE